MKKAVIGRGRRIASSSGRGSRREATIGKRIEDWGLRRLKLYDEHDAWKIDTARMKYLRIGFVAKRSHLPATVWLTLFVLDREDQLAKQFGLGEPP